MTRHVITPDVAIALVESPHPVRPGVRLVAPTLSRSQMLAELHRRSQTGIVDRARAAEILDGIRGLRIRLLGDRVLQAESWGIAAELGWQTTFDAEYVALTRLQADALVTADDELAASVDGLIDIADFDDLIDPDNRKEPH